ncbi:MAG: secretin N-terminal domain-containing protein, partial [Planctomycetota bacterium]|nr:secretin N-terminal domain-containing protein [Planctomycetota bacterium]
PPGAVVDGGDYIELRFDETDEGGLTLRQFVKIAQINTGLNFTVDATNPNIGSLLNTKKILLYGTKRITKDEFYSFFQIMLKIYGFVTVKQGAGDLAVIVITQDSAQTKSMIRTNQVFVEPEQVETFATQPATFIATVYPLRYAVAQQLGSALRTSIAGNANSNDTYTPLPTVNSLLIQGYGPFVAASVRMLRILDVEPFKKQPSFTRIQLHQASAEDLADLVTELIEDLDSSNPRQQNNRGQDGAAQQLLPTRVLANTRDNSLLVITDPEKLDMIKDLIAQLDTEVETPELSFRTYQLENISAKDLQKSLKAFLKEVQQGETRRGGNSQNNTISRNEQPIVLEAQEETNTLLITASRSKWLELERMLDTLDRRQKQVSIETALIEVSEDFNKEIGFEYASVNYPNSDGSQTGFGFTSMGISTLTDSDGDGTLDTRILDPNRSGFTAGILDGTEYGIPMLLAAAQSRNDANILSVPSILVTNNRGARVESLDEIPTSTQSATQGVGVTTTFDGYQEAGITLSITPSISAGRYLRLGISLEISAFRGTFTPGQTLPPTRITRKLDTTVYLPDGATMWIGGIVRDDMTTNETGIPLLSDLPVLGWIFGSQSNANVKTTLFFFCTPRILDDEDFAELADISKVGKAKAANVIGLNRVQRVDPSFQVDHPLDIISDEDIDGDGHPETGQLDFSGFAAPVFDPPSGLLQDGEMRQLGFPDTLPAEELDDPTLDPSDEIPASSRSLPESGR